MNEPFNWPIRHVHWIVPVIVGHITGDCHVETVRNTSVRVVSNDNAALTAIQANFKQR